MDGEKGFDFPLKVSVHPGKLKLITRNNQQEGYSNKQSFSFHDVKKATLIQKVTLKVAGLDYFEKKPEEVKPTDFVELDYKRSLEYHSQVFMKDL